MPEQDFGCLACRKAGKTGKSARNRGNCPSHYHKHLAMVAAGETTWEQLEADGLTSPRKSSSTWAWRPGVVGGLRRD